MMRPFSILSFAQELRLTGCPGPSPGTAARSIGKRTVVRSIRKRTVTRSFVKRMVVRPANLEKFPLDSSYLNVIRYGA